PPSAALLPYTTLFRSRTPGDGFGGQDALLAGDVGQERRAGDVADGVNAGHPGFHALIDPDEAPFYLYAHAFQAEAFRVADDADGHQHLLRPQDFPAGAVAGGHPDGQAVLVLVDAGHGGAG